MMNAKHLCAIGLAVASAALLNIPALAQEVDGSPDVQAPFPKMHRLRGAIPKQYIVVFRNEITKEEVRQIAKELKIRRRRILQEYTNVLNGFAIQLTEQEAKLLSQDERVEYVQEDGLYTVNQVSLQSCKTAAADGHVPKCVSQQTVPWNIDRLNQTSTTLDNKFTWSGTGKNVNVYVVDTGIRTTHTEFQGRATSVYDAVKDGNGSRDCNGHGTFVAGLIGGYTYGIAKEVKLNSVRVLDCSGNGSSSNIIAGINWITANAQRPAVVNISFGGARNDAIDNAIMKSIDSGIVYIVAAGNDNVDASNISPARVPQALTIGALDQGQHRAGFSNYGGVVDFYLPGVGVYSAFSTSNTAQALSSGTSMAAPIAAGMAAVALEWNPNTYYVYDTIYNILSARTDLYVDLNATPTASGETDSPSIRQTTSGSGNFRSFGTPFIY
jgi:hypothetical protein